MTVTDYFLQHALLSLRAALSSLYWEMHSTQSEEKRKEIDLCIQAILITYRHLERLQERDASNRTS